MARRKKLHPGWIWTGLILMVLGVSYLLCDPLYRFAVWASYQQVTNGMWQNGLSTIVELPANTNVEDVIQASDPPSKVFEMKRIWYIGSTEPHWAARVEENGRLETLLICFVPGNGSQGRLRNGFWDVKGY